MTILLFIDSSTSVTLTPEFTFKDEAKKLQSTMRTQAGTLIQYKFATFPSFKIPVKYINDTDKDQLHEWWRDNDDLTFAYGGSEYTVRIVNKTNPVSKTIKPYDNLWQGELKLEGY